MIISTLLVALEMEAEDGATSRDPLTLEPGDPAPQKKKKKKRTPTSGRLAQAEVRLRLQSPEVRLHLPDQDPENPDVANGNADEPAEDGDDVNVAARKTKKKRWVSRAAWWGRWAPTDRSRSHIPKEGEGHGSPRQRAARPR